MNDHPQYAMWKARYEAEQATQRARLVTRARREALRTEWDEAWHEYRVHWHDGLLRSGATPWWHLRTWLRILFWKKRP